MPSNPYDNSALPELKRFLDRLLSAPEDSDTQPHLQQEQQRTALALGVIDADAGTSGSQPMTRTDMIERTRACIHLQEPTHPSDQLLETMPAPPAMPEATP